MRLLKRLLPAMALFSCAFGFGSGSEASPARTRHFDTQTVSHGGVDVDPKGRIVLTVAGTLQRVGSKGGQGTQLRTGSDYVLEPRLSPNGRMLAYLSNARPHALPGDDFFAWIARADGTHSRQLTSERLSSVTWAANSTRIFAIRKGSLVTLTLDGKLTDLKIPVQGSVACCFGERLLLSEGDTLSSVNLRTRQRERLVRHNDAWVTRPVVSRDGRSIFYIVVRKEVAELRRLEIGSRADDLLARLPVENKSLARITHEAVVGPVASFGVTSDGQAAVYAVDGSLYRARVQGVEKIPVSFEVARKDRAPRHPPETRIGDILRLRQLRWPAWMPDGDVIVSAGGHLWRSTPSALAQRLTKSHDLEYFPSLSPDAQSLAYVAVTSSGSAQLRVRRLANGEEVTIASSAVLARPVFSPDGASIAFYEGENVTEEIPTERPKGTLLLKVVRIRDGEQRILNRLDWPQNSISQYYPPLVWSGDGSIYFQTDYDGAEKDLLYALNAIDPHTGRSEIRLRAANGTDFIIASPSGRLAAIYARRRLSIIDLANSHEIAGLDHVGAQFLSWKGEDEVRFTSGNIERKWRIGARSLQAEREIRIQVKRAAAVASYAFVDATVLSMGPKGDLEHHTVLIENGRIKAIGPNGTVAIPEAATVIDTAGKFLMPGLIDTHTHAHFAVGGEPDLLPHNYWRYSLSLAFGITTFFDPSSSSTYAFSSAELVEAGETLGPRVFSTGWSIYDGSPGNRGPVSPEDARTIAKSWKEQGALLLKSYYLNRDQRRWLVDAAAEAGLAVTTEGFLDDDDAIPNLFEDGASSFEHSPRVVGRDDLQNYVATSDVWLTPTLMIGAQQYLYETKFLPLFKGDPRISNFMPKARGDEFTIPVSVPPTRPEEMAPREAQSIAQLDRMGVMVSVGAHGIAPHTHIEMWAMSLGGMPNGRVLAAATINGARKLGLDRELGSVEVGKLADLLILRRDPRKDITATLDAAWVVARGQVLDPATLKELH